MTIEGSFLPYYRADPRFLFASLPVRDTHYLLSLGTEVVILYTTSTPSGFILNVCSKLSVFKAILSLLPSSASFQSYGNSCNWQKAPGLCLPSRDWPLPCVAISSCILRLLCSMMMSSFHFAIILWLIQQWPIKSMNFPQPITCGKSLCHLSLRYAVGHPFKSFPGWVKQDPFVFYPLPIVLQNFPFSLSF